LIDFTPLTDVGIEAPAPTKIVNVPLTAVFDMVSMVWIVNVNNPVVVGVPLIIPVVEPSVKPVGRLPDATLQLLVGGFGTQLEVAIVWE
jgi:hypothetical protein